MLVGSNGLLLAKFSFVLSLLMCYLLNSVCDLGILVCDLGNSVCELGFLVCDLGYSVCYLGIQ